MASYHSRLHHATPRLESPAKVFARLKLEVQRKGEHGAAVKPPRKRAESTRMTEELAGIRRPGSYRDDVHAWTLSPVSSSNITSRVEERPPERGHGCSPRKRAFLESHFSSLVSKQQVRDSGGFRVISRTPVKVQPVEEDLESSVFLEGCAPLVSSAFKFSPKRQRLRRQCEPQEFIQVSSSSKEVSNGPGSRPQERETPRVSRGDTFTCPEGLGRGRGLSSDPSEGNRFTHDPVFPPPRSTAVTRCVVQLEACPPMSPAKMFAYMKKRESKTKQLEVDEVSSSTRDLFHTSHFHPSRDASPSSTVHNTGEMEDIASRRDPERLAPVNRSRVASADSPWDTDPSEDAPSLSPSPSPSPSPCLLPLLFEDPLVLDAPQVSIPKKQEAVFKRNKWPQSTKFPSESVVYLKKWFLRKNPKGLFVDGIHRDEKVPWNSNIIVDRVSNKVVKTVTGKIYVLVDKMNISVDSGFPKWLLKKFANGFPPDWETLYEAFLSESREEPESNSEGRAVVLKTRSKTRSKTPSVVGTVKRHKDTSVKTSDACLSASSRPSVSRSGRLIKPPLEYWKGGRVITDAHMNVTIHDGYDTSICAPAFTTRTTRAPQKPARVFLACSEGRQQRGSASEEEASVPVRRVKASLRKHNSAKEKPKEKPSYAPEPPVEPRSPEERSGRRTRSSRRRPTTETTLCVDAVPQKQREPEESSTRRSKKQTRDITRPSGRVLGSKRAFPPQKVHDDQTPASSDDEVIGRKTSGEEVHRKRGRRVRSQSRPSYVFPSSESSRSSDETEKEPGKRTRVTQTRHKQSRRTKSSSPTKPKSKRNPKASRGTAPSPQEQDADEWTEAELSKLQEAVTYYPKHMGGYWAKVARMVGTRSAEECHFQHTSQGTAQTPAKRAKNPKKEKKEKKEAARDPGHQLISARAGTLKRKQQVRQFLEAMPREDVEDVFSSTSMQNKRFEMPSLCPSDHDFALSEMEPLTPGSTGFPEVKTPQCLHITPGMMGSPNRSNDDKYVFQLQKRMKKNQFNVCKRAPSSKSFTPTPSMKRAMRRCGNTENDTFVVWEMFPGTEAASDSGGEEDFYFSEND